MKTAVCIVNWFGFEDTARCLASLSLFCKDVDILLLENGSGQEAKLRAIADRRTRLFISDRNLGFAGGNNRLLREALALGYDAIYLLNNDTEVREGVLEEPLRLLAMPGCGFVQSKLVLAGTDRLDNAGHLHLNSGDVIPEGRGCLVSEYVENREITSGCAAALLVGAEMLREVGLFDEGFFLSYEDVELTSRAWMRGWRGVFCASSVVDHRLGASIAKARDQEYYVRSQRNNLLAYAYHTPWVVVMLNVPWILLKFAGVVVAGWVCQQRWIIGVYRQALWETAKCWRRIFQVRRESVRRRRVRWWSVWRMQRNCIPDYVHLFWQLFVGAGGEAHALLPMLPQMVKKGHDE